MEIVERADYDVVVEMTPLNIFSGQPAIEHIEKAFMRKTVYLVSVTEDTDSRISTL